MLTGPNQPHSIYAEVIADPGAGTNFTCPVFAYVHNAIYVIRFRLVTDATVANRYPALTITPPVGQPWTIFGNLPIAASQTVDVTFMAGQPTDPTYATNLYTVGLPRHLWMPIGSVVTSNIRQLQAGDAITLICATWEQVPAQV